MHTHAMPTGRRLQIAAVVTTLFVFVEFAAGLWANSLGLISDAGHNLSDAVSLLLTLWAFYISTRPADDTRTFGYHRVGVLAALFNAVTLVLLAGYVGYEGYLRLIHPEPVASLPMIIVSIIAFGVNAGIMLSLRGAGNDLNIRSALMHMAGDALASLGVLVAGIGVMLTGSPLWDAGVSMLIALFVLLSSWGILRESLNILLEGRPEGLSVDEVAHDIAATPGVRSVHDLHVWSLGSNINALSAHLVVDDAPGKSYAGVAHIVGEVKEMLASRYTIVHSTLETHCAAGEEPLACCGLQHVDLSHIQAHAHGHSHAH